MNLRQARTPALHLRHRWQTIEAIGHVVTQRCQMCARTRVRVRSGPLPVR
ncbi:hypothetical protein [Sphaerisporangium siamense]|uniref:Uncharacterized protein n=1 Tax=Sphaerisporangium siamense TaxID=795645 RepID=A0A7W7DEL3_9ACTN|nr:hypothetical protein [Sphaerisporangium siamense]MBB4705079.1 hypothetical protein [Sphaerisporangium siamense]